jgi:hypothetical protein
MEEPENNGVPSLSVVRYDNNRDIVLRHADAIVVVDPETKQLVPLSQNQDVDTRSPRSDLCPMCRRPWPPSQPGPVHNGDTSTARDEPNFITNDYFHMLNLSG